MSRKYLKLIPTNQKQKKNFLNKTRSIYFLRIYIKMTEKWLKAIKKCENFLNFLILLYEALITYS